MTSLASNVQARTLRICKMYTGFGYSGADGSINNMMREEWIVEMISSGSAAVIVIFKKEVK